MPGANTSSRDGGGPWGANQASLLPKTVGIVVLNWNGRELLRSCLSSLRLTTYPRFKAIVVDNGSTDRSQELVRSNFPEAELVALDKNEGYPKGNNIGSVRALGRYNADYVVLLNNDTVISDKSWLTHMVAVAEADPRVGIVNCRFVTPDGMPQPMGIRLLPGIYIDQFLGISVHSKALAEQDASVHTTDSAGGACFMVKRSVIESIGLLDEGYTPIYFEDVDYCHRARKVGFKLVHDGAVSIIHVGSASKKRVSSSYLTQVYRKNLLRYIGRNYPLVLPLFVIILAAGSGIRAAQSAISEGSAGAAARVMLRDFSATLSGLQGLRSVVTAPVPAKDDGMPSGSPGVNSSGAEGG